MRKTYFSWSLAAAACGLVGSVASAQQPARSVSYPSQMRTVSARMGEAPACATCEAPAEEAAECKDPCDWCDLGEPFKIGDHCFFKEHGLNAGGWLAQSFTANFNPGTDRFNGIVSWNDRANEYQLNQFYGFLEKPLDIDPECGGWGFGYRVDALYGTDSRFSGQTGLELFGDGRPNWNRSNRFMGLILPQFYAQVGYNDLNVKIGHFYSLVGYEVVATTGNFFPNLPNIFQYGEPFTHTGILANYKGIENLDLYGGIIRGWDNFDNSGNPSVGYHGAAILTAENGQSFALTQTYSRELAQTGAFTPRLQHTMVLTLPLTEKLKYVGQVDFTFQNDAIAVNGADAWWYGVNQYLFYTVNDCLTYGLRWEWFRDEDGFRVGGTLAPQADGSLRGLSTLRNGYIGDFYQVTAGLNYKPSANWLIRPFVRYDKFDGEIRAATNPGLAGGGGAPFQGGESNYQWLLGSDIIFTY